ncbi:hypothetical protein DL93DRAFT_2152664 [Clavulina sp. PMI_390]|nr:hypothetical protein DL93DRAFT_2152664 [Clavulina sp. PMI_390]
MPPPLKNHTLCVRRGGVTVLSDAVIVQRELDVDKLVDNEAILRVDKFGFSANNLTYGLLGEHPNFRHPSLCAGQRLSGYLPMSSYCKLRLDPPRVRPGDRSGIEYTVNVALDGMPEIMRPYRQLTFCETDFMWSPKREDEMMLWLITRLHTDLPLFWASYWMEDRLHERAYHSARTVLISSASAKTAFLIAYRLQKRRKATTILSTSNDPQNIQAPPTGLSPVNVVGLTSRANLAFTKRLGFYDHVLAYDEVANISEKVSAGNAPNLVGECVYVDVSGNEALNANITKYLKPKLSISLGSTSGSSSSSMLAGADGGDSKHQDTNAKQESFFMPEWLALRAKQLGAKQVKAMQKAAWAELMEDCPGWVTIKTYDGLEEVMEAYQRTVKGGIRADEGQMFSLSSVVQGGDDNKKKTSVAKL